MSRFSLKIMMNRQRLLKPLILAISLLFGAGIVRAQNLEWPTWKQLGDPFASNADQFSAIFFYDTLHGVAAVTIPNAGAAIYYTHDASRWYIATMPSGVTTVREIRPVAGKLYAATDGQDVLVSTDQGATWSYSGFGLANAYDVYADPSGKIRTLTNQMRLFARVDGLHCVAAGLSNAALISNDGGVTWSTLSIGDDTLSYAVYGDTCRHVFLYHNNEGAVWRSSDDGVTWQNPLIGSGDYPEIIEGSNEVVYVSTVEGLYRTTDDAFTYWSDINSVGTGPPLFCVFGPMGNDVAVQGTPPLYDPKLAIWSTNDGGDYALRSPVDLADALGNLVNTLGITSPCPGLRIPIPFLTPVDSFITTMVVTQDSLSEFTLEGPAELHFTANVPDTAWFDFTPRSMPETSTLTIDFYHSWNCSSWEEARTIVVVSPPLASVTMPSVISGNCSLVSANGSVIYSSPCQPLILTSVSSMIPSLKCTANFPDTVKGGDSIPFQFDPNNSSINGADTVEIKGHYAGTTTSFDEVITVTLDASATAPELSTQNMLDFGAINKCIGVKDTSALYYNHGCVTDTITSIQMGGIAFTWLTNSLPVILPPGDSVQIGYRFTIPDTSTVDPDTATFIFDTGMTYTGTANVNVVSNGDTENISLSITGSTIVGSGLPSISSQYVDCGSLSPCTGDTILSDTIGNPSCYTIVISQIALFNDSNYFTLISPANDTLFLPPGNSGIVRFEFAPRAAGQYTGALNLNSGIINDDETNDIDIIVRGIAVDGSKLLSANTQNVDLGSFYGCQDGDTRDTSVTLFNTGCDTLKVNYVEFSNIVYTSPSRFPFIIPPDSSALLNIHLIVDTNSIYGMNGTLLIFSDADTGAGIALLQPIVLTASIIQPAPLHLSISTPDSAKDGQLATFYLVLSDEDIPSTGASIDISGINFDLTHNDNLLSYVKDSGLSIKRGITINSIESDTIEWGSNSRLPASSLPDTIGSLTFRVYLTDSSSTPLTLSNISLITPPGLTSDCIASISDSGAAFTYVYRCGDDIIQDAMNGSLPFTIESIVPNPAQSKIEIGYRVWGVGYSDLDIELKDILGRTMLAQHLASARQSDISSTSLDVSSIPAGTYYLRIVSQGETVTRKIEVIR